ncbi:Sulfotransferase family cytosolic 2B member 1 [Platysternon megacephalum]|uniref:Sulfotransferase family cytosolic 2B member 1 n=1 Tax=Platysternon megacephalum TaxID=55544 RepID=A0A4D9DXA1_9SAUR|nr:Sulfotransferase family cytosolic 2B member 1 [Platysternon megacephalum]
MFKEYFQYKGISFPRLIYSERGLREVENEFQVRDDDVFNVTYQKSDPCLYCYCETEKVEISGQGLLVRTLSADASSRAPEQYATVGCMPLDRGRRPKPVA